MACIIYYQNLDYDKLPTARKRPRLAESVSTPINRVNTSPQQSLSSNSSIITPSTDSDIDLDSCSNYFLTERYSYNSTNSGDKISYTKGRDLAANSRMPNDTSSRGFNQPEYNTSSPFASVKLCRRTYSAPDPNTLRITLKKYFKFNSFRTNQLEAVNATCRGLDTLVLMPTGGGKSICYQLPAIISSGLTVVISPLKSLIDDQVTRMRSLKVRTSALSGETHENEVNSIISDLRADEPQHKLLYVTPEKINCSGSLLSILKNLHYRGLLARFVIDEAHCVSMWGSDFRPDYRKLHVLREQFQDVPIMALTATAPPKVRDDIFSQLRMNKEKGVTLIQSFNRPNLKFEVRLKNKTCIEDICKTIHRDFSRKCGIIYCLSRNDCETVAGKLREHGISSAPYHAGLSDVQRRKVFQEWSKGTFQVVCATIAFGMGIDKSNVRFVIHYSVPKSVEGYYQEAGRAGRDGQIASCILYFSKSDLYRMRSMLFKGIGRSLEDKERDKTNLDHIISYGENRTECRRVVLLRYLGEPFDPADCIKEFKTACDNCLSNWNNKPLRPVNTPTSITPETIEIDLTDDVSIID